MFYIYFFVVGVNPGPVFVSEQMSCALYFGKPHRQSSLSLPLLPTAAVAGVMNKGKDEK